MASRTRTILIDDLDDAEIPEGEGQTVTFAVGSSTYEIDLSDANLGKLYDALQPFTDRARRVRGGSSAASAPTRPNSRGSQVDREQLQAMRQWASENGYKVSSRGRVSQEIQDAYHSAQ